MAHANEIDKVLELVRNERLYRVNGEYVFRFNRSKK